MRLKVGHTTRGSAKNTVQTETGDGIERSQVSLRNIGFNKGKENSLGAGLFLFNRRS